MESKIKNPPEIMRVKDERGTKSVRLPRWFVSQFKIAKSDYVVIEDDGKGGLKLVLWENHVNAKGKTRTRKKV